MTVKAKLILNNLILSLSNKTALNFHRVWWLGFLVKYILWEIEEDQMYDKEIFYEVYKRLENMTVKRIIKRSFQACVTGECWKRRRGHGHSLAFRVR